MATPIIRGNPTGPALVSVPGVMGHQLRTPLPTSGKAIVLVIGLKMDFFLSFLKTAGGCVQSTNSDKKSKQMFFSQSVVLFFIPSIEFIIVFLTPIFPVSRVQNTSATVQWTTLPTNTVAGNCVTKSSNDK